MDGLPADTRGETDGSVVAASAQEVGAIGAMCDAPADGEPLVLRDGRWERYVSEHDTYRFGPAVKPPLWQLRLPDGRPNYANAAEQERYLRESGWLEWSCDMRANPDPQAAGVIAWETWIAAQNDPRRVPPAGIDVELAARAVEAAAAVFVHDDESEDEWAETEVWS